ncbi:MAG: hypothetical protein IM467_18480 [Microcystis sp. M137S2]|jgi:hypothetical protein|nr:hypothetical protein [Microcystis sp. M137S2]
MFLTKIIKGECYAQTSQRRDNLSMKAKRVEHLQIEIVVGSIKMVAQMLNPYRFVFDNALRFLASWDGSSLGSGERWIKAENL